MLEGIGVAEARTIVELGPGTGPFTRLIAERARPDALVIAMELNRALRRPVPRFRVEIVNDSAGAFPTTCALAAAACRLHPGRPPFVAFSQDLQRRLLDAVVKSLLAGRFATSLHPGRLAAWATLPTSSSRASPGSPPREWLEECASAFVYRCEK
jgi:phospholipid N-methyltransferase